MRGTDGNRLIVDQDLTAVGVVKAVSDPHDRRFPAPFSPTMRGSCLSDP
jgi:hypothetical protein